jgi:transcriptional regulator with XRE-family HTH domain
MSAQPKYETYGQRIHLFRKTRGYSVKRFAHLIGETEELITQWESGNQVPDLETMTKMQEAFDINLTWLATGKEEMLCKKPPRAIGPQIDILLEIAGLKGNSKCKEYIYAFCSHKRVQEPALKAYQELKADKQYQRDLKKRHQHECGE